MGMLEGFPLALPETPLTPLHDPKNPGHALYDVCDALEQLQLSGDHVFI